MKKALYFKEETNKLISWSLDDCYLGSDCYLGVFGKKARQRIKTFLNNNKVTCERLNKMLAGNEKALNLELCSLESGEQVFIHMYEFKDGETILFNPPLKAKMTENTKIDSIIDQKHLDDLIKWNDLLKQASAAGEELSKMFRLAKEQQQKEDNLYKIMSKNELFSMFYGREDVNKMTVEECFEKYNECQCVSRKVLKDFKNEQNEKEPLTQSDLIKLLIRDAQNKDSSINKISKDNNKITVEFRY